MGEFYSRYMIPLFLSVVVHNGDFYDMKNYFKTQDFKEQRVLHLDQKKGTPLKQSIIL